MAKGMKCECNYGLMVLGVIVMAVGLFLTVKGFFMQGQAASMWMTLVYYALGILVWCVGKMFKCKACCGMCMGYAK